jgi:hypothetical protein
LCIDDSEYEVLSLAGIYSVAVPGFIASGGDSYSMLVDGHAGQEQVMLHQTQYEVVVDYFQSDYFDPPNNDDDGGGGGGGGSGGGGRGGGGGDGVGRATVIDLVAEHARVPSTQSCKVASTGSQRVCQTQDVVQIPIGLFCGDEGRTALQECDQAHHMVEAINNKHDGFMDDLLPNARLILHENHVIVPCAMGKMRDAHAELHQTALEMGVDGGMFVATIGPSCSNDVQDITAKEWRDQSISTRNSLVISGTVRGFRQRFTLEDDAIGSNACSVD